MSTGARKQRADEAQSSATIPAPKELASAPITLRGDHESEASGDDDHDKIGEHSARPTTVPDYNVEALAAASFSPLGPPLPIMRVPTGAVDRAIPTRRRGASVDGVPLRAAFLLSHIDDRMTVTELAESAQIPLTDAVDCFTLLADLGIVELTTLPVPSEPPPQSQHRASSPGDAGPQTSKSGLRPRT